MFISKEPLLVIIYAYAPRCPLIQFTIDVGMIDPFCEAVFMAMQCKFKGREDLMDTPIFEWAEWLEDTMNLQPIHPNYSTYDWELTALHVREIITRVEHIYDNQYWRAWVVEGIIHHGPILVNIVYTETDKEYVM